MKKLLFAIALLFSVLGFVGAVYVLSTGGEASAGYAVVPLVLSLGFQQLWRLEK